MCFHPLACQHSHVTHFHVPFLVFNAKAVQRLKSKANPVLQKPHFLKAATWSHFQLTFFLGWLTPKPRATLKKPVSGTVWWPCFDNVQTDVNSFNNIPSLSAQQGTQTIQEALITGLPCWNRKDITMYTRVCEEPVFMATQVSAQEELMSDRQYN